MREIPKIIQKEGTIDIPVSVFSTTISPLEAVVKYLREQYGFSFVEIANLINRDARNISAAYRKYQHKRVVYSSKGHSFPVALFANKKLSILEHVCTRLQAEGMDTHKISRLTGKQQSTIYTVLRRAKKKNINETLQHERRSDLVEYLREKHGLSNREIAATLNISLADVENFGGGFL